MPFQFGPQGLVNSLEAGLIGRIIRVLLIMVFVSFAFGFYAVAQFRGLTDPHAMELADVARNLANGDGFTTKCVRPVDAAFLAAEPIDPALAVPVPDIRHAPAYPYLLSRLFSIVKPSHTVKGEVALLDSEQKVVIPFGIACIFLTGLFVYLLGLRLFDGAVAGLSMAVFFVTHTVLTVSISGSAIPLNMLLATAATYVCVWAVQVDRGGRHLWSSFLLVAIGGAVCGSCVLSSYSMLVLVLMLALFILVSSTQNRWTLLALFLICCSAVVLPWLWRNHTVGSSWLGLAPHEMLRDTILYPGDSFARATEPKLRWLYVSRALKYKFLLNIGGTLSEQLRIIAGGALATALFLISYLCSFERDEANHLRWFMAVAMLFLIAGIALLGDPSSNLLLVFLPLAILYGVAFLYISMDSHDLMNTGWQSLVVWLLVAVTALPAVMKIAGEGPRYPYPPYHAPFVQYVCGFLDPGEALCTDIPAATAWYGNRTALLLPETPAKFSELRERQGNVNAIYLTSETSDRPYVTGLLEGTGSAWLPVVSGMCPTNFPLQHAINLPPGSREQLALYDRPRWTVEVE